MKAIWQTCRSWVYNGQEYKMNTIWGSCYQLKNSSLNVVLAKWCKWTFIIVHANTKQCHSISPASMFLPIAQLKTCGRSEEKVQNSQSLDNKIMLQLYLAAYGQTSDTLDQLDGESALACTNPGKWLEMLPSFAQWSHIAPQCPKRCVERDGDGSTDDTERWHLTRWVNHYLARLICIELKMQMYTSVICQTQAKQVYKAAQLDFVHGAR